MADATKGRQLVVLSLTVMLMLTIALSLLTGPESAPATRYGRPLLVALAALLVWQGKLWARLLLVLLGAGIILAGPLIMAKGVSIQTTAGQIAWTATGLYLASVIALYFSSDVKAFFATREVSTHTVSPG